MPIVDPPDWANEARRQADRQRQAAQFLDDDALHHRIRAADRRRYPLDQPDPEADARIREALIHLADGIGLPDDVLASEDYPADPGGYLTLREFVDRGAHVDADGITRAGPMFPEAQGRARYARRRLGMAASHCRAAWNAIRYGDTPDLW